MIVTTKYNRIYFQLVVEQAGRIIRNTNVQAPKKGFKKSCEPKVITPSKITINRQ